MKQLQYALLCGVLSALFPMFCGGCVDNVEIEKHRGANKLAQLYDYWADKGKPSGFKISDYIIWSSHNTYAVCTNKVTIAGRELHPRFSVHAEALFPGTLIITDEGLFLWSSNNTSSPVVFEHKRKSYRRLE